MLYIHFTGKEKSEIIILLISLSGVRAAKLICINSTRNIKKRIQQFIFKPPPGVGISAYWWIATRYRLTPTKYKGLNAHYNPEAITSWALTINLNTIRWVPSTARVCRLKRKGKILNSRLCNLWVYNRNYRVRYIRDCRDTHFIECIRLFSIFCKQHIVHFFWMVGRWEHLVERNTCNWAGNNWGYVCDFRMILQAARKLLHESNNQD